MTEKPRADAIIIWQENAQMEGVGEPALLLNPYNDLLEIQQGKRSIAVNYDNIDELIKALRTIKLKKR